MLLLMTVLVWELYSMSTFAGKPQWKFPIYGLCLVFKNTSSSEVKNPSAINTLACKLCLYRSRLLGNVPFQIPGRVYTTITSVLSTP